MKHTIPLATLHHHPHGIPPRQWAQQIRAEQARLDDAPEQYRATVLEHLRSWEDHEYKDKKWASHKRKWPRK